jgi:hypothetical protein
LFVVDFVVVVVVVVVVIVCEMHSQETPTVAFPNYLYILLVRQTK